MTNLAVTSACVCNPISWGEPRRLGHWQRHLCRRQLDNRGMAADFQQAEATMLSTLMGSWLKLSTPNVSDSSSSAVAFLRRTRRTWWGSAAS